MAPHIRSGHPTSLYARSLRTLMAMRYWSLEFDRARGRTTRRPNRCGGFERICRSAGRRRPVCGHVMAWL